MTTTDWWLVLIIVACLGLARTLRHRAAYEAAMGNTLRPTAKLNGHSETGRILQRAVTQHDNVAQVCLHMATLSNAFAVFLCVSLIWRII